MELKKLNSLKQLVNIYKLYKTSFPKEERKPFWMISYGHLKGNFEVFSIEENNEFKGLAISAKYKDLALLEYLAITSDERGSGYGSKTLEFFKEYYKDFRLFLEIENSSDEKASNYEERQNRKKFYTRNGFTPLPFNVNLFGVEMEILGYNCSFTFEEYRSVYVNQFWNFMQKTIIENIVLIEKK